MEPEPTYLVEPKYDIDVKLIGENGNAFNLIGIVRRALERSWRRGRSRFPSSRPRRRRAITTTYWRPVRSGSTSPDGKRCGECASIV